MKNIRKEKKRQKISILTKVIIMPRFGTRLFDERAENDLPMTIERKRRTGEQAYLHGEYESLAEFKERVKRKRNEVLNMTNCHSESFWLKPVKGKRYIYHG